MEENKASVTAGNIAAVRAFEAMRPLPERICSDFLAFHFLSEQLSNSPDLFDTLSKIIHSWEEIVPGVCGSIAARTRFIDDCLEKAINEKIEQLVILGAGYDTRAFRFDSLRKRIKVFEIDHPATQRLKLNRLKKHLSGYGEHIIYIPVNFENEYFGKKLFEHGYNRSMPTFFIWEGVSYYLTADAVDDILAFISKNSAPGSEVVFDYFPESFAAGRCHLPEAESLNRSLKNLGEKILFGISKERINDFLEKRGFKIIQNYSSKEYMEIYLQNQAIKGRTFSDLFFFVHAMVT